MLGAHVATQRPRATASIRVSTPPPKKGAISSGWEFAASARAAACVRSHTRRRGVTPELRAMLPFAFALVAGFVSNAALPHAPSADLPRVGSQSITPATSRQTVPCMLSAGRRPLVLAGAGGILPTVRRIQNSVMGPGRTSGRTWEDIVKESQFNRAATPVEFCQQIEREKFNERGDVAHVLYSPRSSGCSFSDEAFAELLRRGYTGERPRSSESMSWDVRTDPIALALVDEKGSAWCMKHSHAEIEMMAVPVRFADFVEIQGSGEGDERVVVNFDDAFRYGITTILANEASTIHTMRAWDVIIRVGQDFVEVKTCPYTGELRKW